MRPKVLLGISGGIDSFVSTLLLHDAGYEVTGVCFDFWESNDLHIVGQLYEQLGLTLIRRQEKDLFQRMVVDAFVRDYAQGRTPSPCCVCNSQVKWILLDRVAKELGIPHIATGHYVRIAQHEGHHYIHRGCDERKDQSYFLWSMPHQILSHSLTPLGTMTKDQVRQIAHERGYDQIVSRRESMGVCFLRGQDYRHFVTAHGQVTNTPGTIYAADGTRMGTHDGLFNYTIGQKRGIPTIEGQAMYVSAMNVADNSISVGTKASLERMELTIEQLNIINPHDLEASHLTVRVRGLGLNPEGAVKIKPLDSKTLHISLTDPAWAIAPGQPVAIYAGDRLVGGGVAI